MDAQPLPDELVGSLRRMLGDLRRIELAAEAWPSVAGDLATLEATIARGDEVALRRALLPLTQAAFEGKVRGRLAGADRRAAFVTATKPTSSLPVVGAVCGAILLVLGYLLGGAIGLTVTFLFAVFIFGIAVAGTRTNAERTEERRARRVSPNREATERAPAAVVAAIRQIEAELGLRPYLGPDRGPEHGG
ncbi:MAG: hypothetical protein M3Z03_10305 [Actinomycetota bacterium]|nr:hypothetical protein [Actinomycetota bacterium]